MQASQDSLKKVDEESVEPSVREVNAYSEKVKSPGVRRVEILAEQYQSWYSRLFLYFSIFLVAYAYGLDGTVRYNLKAYATSSYSTHSLLSTVNCINAVVAAGGQICYARLSDIFGRVEMIIVSAVLYAMGTVIQSQAFDIQRFCAGSVFYQLGYTGLVLTLQIVLADFSTLNWRVAASFVPALPFIINTWISGDVNSALADKWSWGIGMWAIIIPVSCIPLLACLIHMRILANRNEEMIKLNSEQTDFQRLGWKKFMVETFFWKIDLIGLLTSVCVFGFILVPFTLAGGKHQQWKKAKIIVPEVIGILLIPVFFIWEIKFARHPITPLHLLKDRGVWAALVVATMINFVWYMQGDYMYTVLVVAVHESVKAATRITSLYSFVSVITGTLLGFVIVKVKRTKGFILFGVAMWFVSMGMLVHFRGTEQSHSGIIGSLCLMGFGAGFFTYVTQASIQACTTHEHMAVVTALYLSLYNIGSAIGSSVSGAIWTNLLPHQINKGISDKALADEAYNSPLTFIVTYTWGTPERQAVVTAYKHIQKILCTVGLVFCIPLLIAAILLRDYHLTEVQYFEDVDEKRRADNEKSKFFGFLQKKNASVNP